MLVHISSDEKFPVYEIEPINPRWENYYVVSVSDAFMARYTAAKKEWDAVQDELEKLHAAAVLKRGYEDAAAVPDVPRPT